MYKDMYVHSREMLCLLIMNTPFWASYEQEQIQMT